MTFVHWADWFDMDLPDRERKLLEINIKSRLNIPIFIKWLDRNSEEMRGPGHPMRDVLVYIDDLRASGNGCLTLPIRPFVAGNARLGGRSGVAGLLHLPETLKDHQQFPADWHTLSARPKSWPRSSMI